jgi:DNA polymerase-3 subunit delta
MSIEKFHEHLKKGLRKPVYVLHAEEHFILKEALFEIRDGVPPEERDFSFHAFDLDASDEKVSAESALDILNTMPFFGGRQVVAIENSQKFGDRDIERLAAYMEAPSPTAVLVLLNTGTIKKPHREGMARAEFISMDVREADVPYWLAEKARQRGLNLRPGAVDYLIATVGSDLGLLSSEVEKLTNAGKETLDREDVAEIARGSGGYDAFDLARAIEKKDTGLVFRIYRKLRETEEPYTLLGALNWHYAKTADGSQRSAKIFALLNEADTMTRRSGGLYPMELLFLKLLRTSKAR